MPIGGADMPVVISLLNSFTGLAVAADGFAINNLAMVVAGTLVGSSGTLLTLLMCKAMNRPVTNVLFGAFGSSGGSAAAGRRSCGNRQTDSSRRSGVAAHLRAAGRHRSRLRHGRGAGATFRARTFRRTRQTRRRSAVCDSSRRRPHARPHERAARRGERALRPAHRNGSRSIPRWTAWMSASSSARTTW